MRPGRHATAPASARDLIRPAPSHGSPPDFLLPASPVASALPQHHPSTNTSTLGCIFLLQLDVPVPLPTADKRPSSTANESLHLCWPADTRSPDLPAECATTHHPLLSGAA